MKGYNSRAVRKRGTGQCIAKGHRAPCAAPVLSQVSPYLVPLICQWLETNRQNKNTSVCNTLYKEFHTFYFIFITTLWHKASSITNPFFEFRKSIFRRSKWFIQVICLVCKLTMTWTQVFSLQISYSFFFWRPRFSFILKFSSRTSVLACFLVFETLD